MIQNYLKKNGRCEHYKSISISKYIVLFCSIMVTSSYMALNDNDGFKFMFLVPLIFGVYYFFSNLKYYFLNSMPITFFIIVLIFRYLITPFVMVSANCFSAMFNGAITSIHQQQVGTNLMIYEMICIFVTIEICIKIFKKNQSTLKQKEPYHYPNSVLIVSIFIGIASLFLFPQLLEDFNFLFVKDTINITNRNTVVTICSYFAEFAQIFIFIIIVKYYAYKKDTNDKYNTFFLLVVAILNISLMWSANRMTIFLVGGTTLTILLYYFPKKKKVFLVTILILSVFMVILLSSYRLFGSTGATVSSDFSSFFEFKKLSTNLQIYFAGPDSIAGAVGVKEYYGRLITGKTFLNDSFGSVLFIQQLPIIHNDLANTTFRMFNYFCSNGYNPGLIIPMVGQGYIYFGPLLAPVFSIISVVLLFISEKKSNIVNDVAYKYVFIFLTFNFALFPMYNYTLIMQNIFARFIPIFTIVWLNKHLYLKKVRKKSNVNIC